jgi:Domain of unknown function (DUF4160)
MGTLPTRAMPDGRPGRRSAAAWAPVCYGEAKFWLRPVTLAAAWGYSARELRAIERIVVAHRDEFLRAWDTFFRP